MGRKPKKWIFSRLSTEELERLREQTGLNPVICQILVNRGINSIEVVNRFIKPDLRQIFDPFLLKDMNMVVERISLAIKRAEKILIFGDYDVDGISSAAVLSEFLKEHGARVEVRLPNRLSEGYGLSLKVVEGTYQEGIRLIITVDCGISDYEAAELARQKGIDLIITDHHHPPDCLPQAFGIINPKQIGCPYPYKDLAGVGIALKVAQSLVLYWQKKQKGLSQIGFWPSALNKYLDLVCLGTIADIMPLTGENRVLVKFGLEQLSVTRRPGLVALKAAAGITDKKMTTGLVAFGLAPRINAAGRMWGPEEGLKLLCTQSPEEAKGLSSFLNLQNQKRRQTEDKILAEAYKRVEKDPEFNEKSIIVLSDQQWHPGVIGIVAQRLVEKFYLPAILISVKEGFGKGSARSIPQIHIYELLSHCQDLLENFGGHAAAAGLTIEERNIVHFDRLANQIIKKQWASEVLLPEIKIDAEVDAEEIGYSLIDQLNALDPFGYGNPEPTLCLKGLYLASPPRLLKDAHLKLFLKHGPLLFEAIGFNMRPIWEKVSSAPVDQRWDIAFSPQINKWQGRAQIQLRLKDVKVNDPY